MLCERTCGGDAYRMREVAVLVPSVPLLTSGLSRSWRALGIKLQHGTSRVCRQDLGGPNFTPSSGTHVHTDVADGDRFMLR